MKALAIAMIAAVIGFAVWGGFQAVESVKHSVQVNAARAV